VASSAQEQVDQLASRVRALKDAASKAAAAALAGGGAAPEGAALPPHVQSMDEAMCRYGYTLLNLAVEGPVVDRAGANGNGDVVMDQPRGPAQRRRRRPHR
jgi:hypothetical protein